MEKSFLNTERNIALIIIFSIISFGIYGIWYFIKFQNDIKDKSGEGFGGWGTFFIILLTFGIYGIYWNYATGKRLVKAGVTNKDNSVLNLILSLVGLGWVNTILWQLAINEKAQSGTPLKRA
ncbi:MAG: DUF4234 domain-containing protein [Proteobacteria bacterium]|nr:DUF4234 domain-containing protein [Pseudomonadota bacterium]